MKDEQSETRPGPQQGPQPAPPQITPKISLGHEGDMRVTPYTSAPAPTEPARASAVAAYSTPVQFDWRTPKPSGGRGA